jgi:cytochrome P450
MDFNWNIGALPYNMEWRQQRREFHQYLDIKAVQKYHPIMNEETRLFLQKISANPDHIFIGLQS